MFGIISRVIKSANTKNIQNFETLQALKGDNIFNTFLNVRSYNNLLKLKKEVKSLKKVVKRPKGISKEERKRISKEQKTINNNLREPFYQAIETIKLKPRTEQDVAIKEIRQSIFEERLKLKQEQGKAISNLDILELKNPKIRDIESFIKTKTMASILMNLFNIKDIKDANDKLGAGAAAEEVGKTTSMCFIGLSILKYVKTNLKNIITATSIHCPAGRYLKGTSLPLAIVSSIAIKPIMDKCWVTEYEKIKNK